MKNKILLFITAIMLCFVSTVSAMRQATFSTKATGSSSFSLKLEQVQKAQIQVTLKDGNGIILLKEAFEQHAIDNRIYNIKNLPTGTYFLVVEYDEVIKVQPITKETYALTIETQELQTIAAPVFAQSAGFMHFKMACPSGLPVYVKIKDSTGSELYSQRMVSEGHLNRRYNIKQLKEGEYTFSVQLRGAVVNHDFDEHIIITTP